MSETPPPEGESRDAQQVDMNPPEAIGQRILWGDLAIALGVVGLGVYFVVGAFNVRVLPSYAQIGPRFFPFLVAGGLLLCGALLLLQALQGRAAPLEEAEDVDVHARADWRAIVILGAALLVDLLLIERLGFVIASSLLFWGVALGFGSRHVLRDPAVGLMLSVAVYLAFTRLLDLNLPPGILPFVLVPVAG